jgi:hypothetical protein
VHARSRLVARRRRVVQSYCVLGLLETAVVYGIIRLGPAYRIDLAVSIDQVMRIAMPSYFILIVMWMIAWGGMQVAVRFLMSSLPYDPRQLYAALHPVARVNHSFRTGPISAPIHFPIPVPVPVLASEPVMLGEFSLLSDQLGVVPFGPFV